MPLIITIKSRAIAEALVAEVEWEPAGLFNLEYGCNN